MTDTATRKPLRGLDLFIEVVAYDDVYPERWSQGTWLEVPLPEDVSVAPASVVRDQYGAPYVPLAKLGVSACGAYGCIAGNAGALAGHTGYKMVVELGSVGYVGAPTIRFMRGSQVLSADEMAKKLFGLESTRAGFLGDLFAGSNSRDDVIEIGSELFGIRERVLRSRIFARAQQLRSERNARKATAK